MTSDAGTVAAALASFRERGGLDHASMAAWLSMNTTQLATLALCARPIPTLPPFATRVNGLARRYGADPGRLAEVLGG